MENQELHKEASNRQDEPDKRKIAIVIKAILILAIAGGLIYKLVENLELEKQNQATQVQLDLAYDTLDSMSNELDVRILKIAQLGGEIDTLLQIKNQLEEDKKAIRRRSNRQISGLKDQVDGYRELLLKQDVEIERLKLMNDSLLVENTDLKMEKNELSQNIRNLSDSKSALEEKVALASQLKLDGVRIFAVTSKGKERESQFKNRHVDQLKVQFRILENRVAPIEGKDIMIKITAPDGKVIFDVASGSGTFVFEGREMFFTAKKEILYDRNSQSLTFMYQKGNDYALGKHTIEVYADDYKMGENSFLVK